MSYFWYLAGSVPLKEIDNRYCEYISLHEALNRGGNVSECILHETTDMDKVTAIWYPKYEDSVETLIISQDGEETLPWIRTFFNGKYFANLYFDYSDKRAEHLISYMKEYIAYAGEIELWHIWVDNLYPMPPPKCIEQSISDLTVDHILECMFCRKPVVCLRVAGRNTKSLPVPWENDPRLLLTIHPETKIHFIPDESEPPTPEEILRKVRAYVKGQTLLESTGHDWWHILRVVSLAKKINEKEKADEFKIILTALLHDIVDEKFFTGDQTLALKNIFAELNLTSKISDETLDEIIFTILHLGFKGGFEKTDLTPEGKIVQDADRLDAIGAIGIARTFAFGASKGQPIFDPETGVVEIKNSDEYRTLPRSTINHFYEKLLLLKDQMNTDTAREIAEERHKFMEKFLEEFFKEWEI